jgi:hypothetical protein
MGGRVNDMQLKPENEQQTKRLTRTGTAGTSRAIEPRAVVALAYGVPSLDGLGTRGAR